MEATWGFGPFVERKKETMYNETVLDHFNNPRNVGESSKKDGVMALDGITLLIETTITSPTEAYRLFVPPNTRIQRASFAPLLSHTVSLDSACIIIT